VEKHPNADKLNLCQVDDGSQQVAVVCGAGNVRVGLKVAFARVGAELPGIRIKKAKLRGIESQGMICSAMELQLAETSEGILELPADAPSGASIVDYLSLADRIIDVDLTPNRGDCLSIAGVAREVSAINRMPLIHSGVGEVADSVCQSFAVELEAAEHCPRYAGRVISGSVRRCGCGRNYVVVVCVLSVRWSM